MENNIQDIEWIERYLNPGTAQQEKLQMEERMANEPELKSKFFFQFEKIFWYVSWLNVGFSFDGFANTSESCSAFVNASACFNTLAFSFW